MMCLNKDRFPSFININYCIRTDVPDSYLSYESFIHRYFEQLCPFF